MVETTGTRSFLQRCPVCGVPQEVLLLEIDNIHFLETYPGNTYRIAHLIKNWIDKIPKTYIDLEKIHIHFSLINVRHPPNIETNPHFQIYKEGKCCTGKRNDFDAIQLFIYPELKEYLEESIVSLLVAAAYLPKVNNTNDEKPYMSISSWGLFVKNSYQELIDRHGSQDLLNSQGEDN